MISKLGLAKYHILTGIQMIGFKTLIQVLRLTPQQ